jgi:hypothetical protein
MVIQTPHRQIDQSAIQQNEIENVVERRTNVIK